MGKVVVAPKGHFSGDGKTYYFPKPNLYTVRAIFDKFVEDMEKELKPVGIVLSQHGSTPDWIGNDKGENEATVFDLTRLKRMTFHLTVVSCNLI